MSQSYDGQNTLRTPRSLPRRIFDGALGQSFTLAMNGITTITRLSPSVQKRLSKLKVIKNVTYGPLGKKHLLDIYTHPSHCLPARSELSKYWQAQTKDHCAKSLESNIHKAKRPFVLYIHGGGFRTLSKDTHWPFGLSFAEAGFVTFVINYRLTPQYSCPAGLEDCAIALDWLLTHHENLGLDLNRGMIAGESAGGHLTLALTLLLLKKDREIWAQKLYEHQWLPKVIAPACAFLKLDVEQRRQENIRPLYLSRLRALGEAYLNQSPRADLADPLAQIQPQVLFDRPFPPVLITVGGADVILEDSEDLAQALELCGIDHKLVIYPNGIHAFHAVIFHSLAQRCWQDHFQFWEQYDHQVHHDQSDH